MTNNSQWLTREIPFTGKLDTQSDSDVLSVGKLRRLENAIFVRRGALEKRKGYTAKEYGADFLHSDKTLIREKDGEVFAGNNFVGLSSGISFKTLPILDTIAEQKNPRVAQTQDFKLVAWQSGTSVMYYRQIEGFITDIITLPNADKLSVISGDNVIIISTYNPASNEITIRTVDKDGNENVFTPISSAIGVYEIVFYGSNVFIAYATASTVELLRFSIFGILQSNTTQVNTTVEKLAFDVIAGFLVLVHTGPASTILNTVVISDPFTTPVVEFTQSNSYNDVLAIGVKFVPGKEEVIIAFQTGSLANNIKIRYFNCNSLSTVSESIGVNNVSLLTQPFFINSIPYIIIGYESKLGINSSYFVLQCYKNKPQECSIIGNISQYPGKSALYQRVNLPKIDKLSFAVEIRKNISLDIDEENNINGVDFVDLGLEEIKFSFNKLSANKGIFNNNLKLRGSSIVENCFWVYPELDLTLGSNVHPAVSLSAGNILPGTYGYKVTYKKLDGQESFALGFSVLVSVNSKVTLTIPALNLTNSDDVFITVYRTTNNGLTYHQISSDNPNITGDNGFLLNNKSSISLSFVDNLADSSNGKIHTGELASIAIPFGPIQGYSKRRLFNAKLNRVYYSKLISSSELVEFNDQLFFDLSFTNGDITGITTLNDQCVIFKENDIYSISGDGPNNLGFGGFSEPVLISNDSGCTNQNTIVKTPFGIFYNSKKGKYLLGNNFQTTYVGAAVEKYNNLNCVSAELLPNSNAVIFFHSDGPALYYDYNFNSWSVFTGHKANSSCVHNNKLVYSTDNKVLTEYDGYLDDNQPYSLLVETAPIRLTGVMDYWRVRKVLLLAEFFSAHKLTFGLKYDRETFNKFERIFDSNDIVDNKVFGDNSNFGSNDIFGGEGQEYEISVRAHPQKCQTVAVYLKEFSSLGKALSLKALNIEFSKIDYAARTHKNGV